MPACSAAQTQGAFSRSLFSRESNVGGTNLRVRTFCDDNKLLDGPWLASWCTTSDPSVLPLASFVWNDVAHFSGVYHWLKFRDRLFELCAVMLVLVSILVLFEFELICDASHICDRASSHVLNGLFLAKGDILSASGASSGDKVRKDDVASDSPARKLFDGTIMSLLSDVLDCFGECMMWCWWRLFDKELRDARLGEFNAALCRFVRMRAGLCVLSLKPGV